MPSCVYSPRDERRGERANGFILRQHRTQRAELHETTEYRGPQVPDILLSGDHKRIAEWRKREAERRTQDRDKTGP